MKGKYYLLSAFLGVATMGVFLVVYMNQVNIPQEKTSKEDKKQFVLSESHIIKRTKESNHYDNGNGTITAIIGSRLNYERDPGEWEPIDLTFRENDDGWIADRNDVIVKVDEEGLSVIGRDGGEGIKWILESLVEVSESTAYFENQGLLWRYNTTKSGIKPEATVTEKRGKYTYTFKYERIGGNEEFTIDENGNLVLGDFRVPRAFITTAREVTVQCSPWEKIGDDTVTFTCDDTGFAAEDFPYELDPSTTFNVVLSADDGYTFNNPGTSTYPPSTCATVTLNSTVRADKNRSLGVYLVATGHIRWDTSSLPDDATVTDATLRVVPTAITNVDARSLTADWHEPGTIACDDWTTTVGTDAHSGTALSSITTTVDNDFTLTNVSNVNLTGYTGLRLHISGGAPTFSNIVQMAAIDHTTYTEPRLIVTYTTPQITFSGTIYSDEGVTQLTAGGNTITLSVGTSTPGTFSTTTDSGSGAWKIENITGVAIGNPVLVWIDNDSSTRGMSLTKASSTGENITGFDIYQNRLILKHEGTSGTSTTNADLSSYDQDNDPDILFSSNGGVLTSSTSVESFVWAGDTFAPGGTVSLDDVDIRGTLDTNTTDVAVNIAGDVTIAAAGTWDRGSGVLTFNGSGTQTYTDSSSASTLGSVVVGGTTNTLSLGSNATSTYIRIASGDTLDLNTYTLLFNNTTATTTPDISGTLTVDTSTLEYKSTAQTGVATSTYYNLIFNSSGQRFNISSTTVSNNLTITAGTLDADGTTTVKGTFTNADTLIESNGLVSIPATSVALDKASYDMDTDTSLTITLIDPDENKVGTTTDSSTGITVTISSGSDSEAVTLTETGNQTNIFTGTLTLSETSSNTNNNGSLEFSSNGTITLAYTDSEDSNDSAATDTATITIATVVASGSSETSASTNGGVIVGLLGKYGWPSTDTPALVEVSEEKDTDEIEKVSALFVTSLYRGLVNDDVRRLQELLSTMTDIYPEGLVTGYFGPLTQRAVERFQLHYGVVSTESDPGYGYVGPKTRGKLQEVFGDESKEKEEVTDVTRAIERQIRELEVIVEDLLRQMEVILGNRV